MSRYVVTGCAGFIGSHLVDALLADGHRVVGIDAFTDYYAHSLKEQNLALAGSSPLFELVEADLAEHRLDDLLANTDGVFHLAGQPGVRDSWGSLFELYVRRNVVASQCVFEAAARTGVRVALASSSSVYGDAETHPTQEEARPRPVSGYGVTKLACEHLVSAYAVSRGLDAVVLRYFTVYGPRQRPDMAFARIVASLDHGVPFTIYGSGEQARDFTYVGDVVDATRAAMELAPAGAVFNVGGGEIVSLNKAIDLIEELAGRRLEVCRQSPARGDAYKTSADTSRIRAELGWRPHTSLAAGLVAQLRASGLEVSPSAAAPVLRIS